MAHPKRKTSKTRRDKRRTHYKAEMPRFQCVQKLVRAIYTTGLTGMKVGYIIKAKYCWTTLQNQRPSKLHN